MNSLEDTNLIRLREKLKKDQIKLWLPPYVQNHTEISILHLQSLSKTYASLLHLPHEICYETLLTLLHNSLENVQQENLYLESGVATLKIKVLQPSTPSNTLKKEVKLNITGAYLKSLIKQDIPNDVENLKLICNGKVLKDDESLEAQGLKNGQRMLAIALTENLEQLVETENNLNELKSIKYDSYLLALDNSYLDLEDQFGNQIQISEQDRKTLILAMMLHEKGRSALKKKQYNKALIFFVEAEQEFQSCNANLLQTFDNYAILGLDIAWCYLCLESLIHLPEVRSRLTKCEERFHKIYGKNLERLLAVKGATGNEEVLLMRLHLLQAIILYHQNDIEDALRMFKKVEEELNKLKVDERCVSVLLELGYSRTEATIGLRSTAGHTYLAAQFIDRIRKIREEARKKADGIKERNQLGLCSDGLQYVNVNLLKDLICMGYNKEDARRALQATNNVIIESIQYMQMDPRSSSSSGEEIAKKTTLDKNNEQLESTPEESQVNNSESSSGESVEKFRKDAAYERLKTDISVDEDDYLDVDLVEEEHFLRRYLSHLEQ